MRIARVLLLMVAAGCAVLGCGGEPLGETPKEKLTTGWRAYSTGDWDFAVQAFRGVEKTPEASPAEQFSAVLGLATTYHQQPNPDLAAARDYYSRLPGLDPSRGTKLSLLGLARIDLKEGDRDLAIEKLEQLRSEFPDTVEADEATVHLAGILFDTRKDKSAPGGFALPPEEDVQRGIEALRERLDKRTDSPLASIMHRMLAGKHVERKQWAQAVEHLRAALTAGITSSRTESAILWQIARIAEMELKDYALAADFYQRFINASRRHVLYHRAHLSLERVKELMGNQAQ